MRTRLHAAAPAAAAIVVVAAALGAAPGDSTLHFMQHAHSQELGLATFHESAAILVDRTGAHNVTTSITLQSVSVQELLVPPALERQIREDGRITAVILTNQDNCILGVSERSCLLVNMDRDPAASGILALQDSARMVADAYIAEINAAFGTDAAFHSVFVHSGGAESSNTATGLPGAASGRTTVSVVYVMPMEDTDAMYQKISAILLPGVIRDSGGFYDAALKLSARDGAKMSFSLVPLDSDSLLQLKVTLQNTANASGLDVIRPLDLAGLDRLERSAYFESGFYPLNSVVLVAIVSDDAGAKITGSARAEIPTRLVDGEKIPTDVDDAGWIFDPASGRGIQAKYLFGQDSTLAPGDLEVRLDGAGGSGSGTGTGLTDEQIGAIDIAGTDTDEQIMIVIAVAATAVAVALFYLRGYSGRPREGDDEQS